MKNKQIYKKRLFDALTSKITMFLKLGSCNGDNFYRISASYLSNYIVIYETYLDTH